MSRLKKAGGKDPVLIKKCLNGSVEAYGQLVDRYSARIINLAWGMTGDRHLAEDVAQEAFVRAYRALAKFQQRAKFSSWLYQIALNLCKDHLKARSRHARPSSQEHMESLEGNPRRRPGRKVLQAELSEKMAEAVNSLPLLYREAFVLRHMQGMDYREVSGILAIPADTVRVRAYRAREMLRQSLSPDVDTYWREMAAKEKRK